MFFQDLKENINGKELHITEWPGSGSTVICLHGFASNSHWWDKMAESLSPVHRVITYDLPGCGDSEAPDWAYGMEEHAWDILAIIDKFKTGRVTLVGHSLGAVTAVYFAAHYGDKLRHLVLLDGGYPMAGAVEVVNELITGLGVDFPSFKKYLEFMRKMPFYSEWSPYMEKWSYYGVTHRTDGSVISKVNKEFVLKELDYRAQHRSPTKELLPKISTPTLLLWAEQGSGMPGVYVVTKKKGEEMAALLPGSRFRTINNSNHFSILTKDQTMLEIMEFIDS
jgi:pimeloyl-ACP methyl ester carboxylesterase